MSDNIVQVNQIVRRVEVTTPGPAGRDGSSTAVSKIIAGTNVTISPTSGLGDVTINSAASGSGTVTSVSGGTALTVTGNANVSPTINHDDFGPGNTTTTLIHSVQTNAQGHVLAMTGDADSDAFRSRIGLKSTAVTDMGTAANNVVQLDGSQRLPNVDGSQLTNLAASEITSGTLSVARGGTGLASISTLLNSNTTKSDVGLGNVENTAISTFAGSSNITTVGTISTGTWGGTAIAYADVSGTPTLGTAAAAATGDFVAASAVSTFGGTLIDDADASAARTTLGVTNTGSYTGQIETAADKDYILDPAVATARTISAFYIKVNSGSGTAVAKLYNGSDLVKQVTASTSTGNQTSLANTSLAADAVLKLELSAASATDVIFSVEYTE